MDGFKDFFEMGKLMDIMGEVPQRPDYHLEGPVGLHLSLVRKQLDNAIGIMQKAAESYPSLSNLDTNYTDEDINLLRIASFTHDLGKKSATRIDGIHWQDTEKLNKLQPSLNKARAIGHEQPYHFNPVARELLQSPIWSKMFDNASFDDKKILWFLVNNHMIGREGMGKKMSRRWIDSNGKYLNDRKLKLLLTFVLMDKMGRLSQVPQKDEELFLKSLEASAEKIKKQNERVQTSHPATQNPADFVKIVGDNMRRQGWTDDVFKQQLKNALRKKSDKDKLGLSDEQINFYIKQYYNM